MGKKLAEELCGVLTKAKTEPEMVTLLEGLMTPQELREVTVRWRLMQHLLAGNTQREIANELGISLGKIARGSRLLQHDLPEFRRLAERIQKDIENDE